MQVIFLKDTKEGRAYEQKEVADGYAMNYLIPNKIALSATEENVKWAEQQKGKHQEAERAAEDALRAQQEEIAQAQVEMQAKANEQGHLFASLHANEIAEAFAEKTGIRVNPEHIHIEQPIKETGEHTVPIRVGEIETSFTLTVKGE